MKPRKRKTLAFMKASKKKGALVPLLSIFLLLLYLVYQSPGNPFLPVSAGERPGEHSACVENLPGPAEDGLVISVGGNIHPLPGSRLPDKVEPNFFCPLVSEIFALSDLNIANLVAPFVGEDYEALNKARARGSAPEMIPLLKESGIDLLQLSGHHILDYGALGLVNTLALLEGHDMAPLGAGLNAEEAFTPYYYTKNGVTVGLLALNASPPPGWSAGTNRLGVAAGEEEIIGEALKEMGRDSQLSLVFVSFHESHSLKASRQQKEYARRLVDLGAHIVVGTGASVVQETEMYQGGLIFYNLGNFTPPPSPYSYQREGVLLTLFLNPRGESLALALPLQLESTVNTAFPATPKRGLFEFKVFKRIKGDAPWEQQDGYFSLRLSEGIDGIKASVQSE